MKPILLLCITALLISPALGAEKAAAKKEVPKPAGEEEPALGEKINVENIKEKYWARGNESELGVVQNRLYSKARKFQLGVFTGMTSTDPFLSVKSLGLHFGFHFSEYLSVNLLYWKSFTSKSSALNTLEEQGKRANTNYPSSYLGGEAMASLLYGKLSLVGKKIIYYDFHLLGGAGMTKTETGSYFTPHLGLGQQVYLTQWMSLRLDYRIMYYKERLVERTITSRLGEDAGTRNNVSHAITLGVDFLFGFIE